MISALLISFGIVFLAEIGDKSQLMVLVFATRFPPWPVLIGITVATAVVHLGSVLLGAALGAALPTDAIAVMAAIAFVGFGLWTLRGDSLTGDGEVRAAGRGRSAALTVGIAFFVAELGDKTMLATVTLSTSEDPVGTWLGSTLGMVAANALAIGLGSTLGARLSDKTVRIGAAAAFFGFAVWLALDVVVS